MNSIQAALELTIRKLYELGKKGKVPLMYCDILNVNKWREEEGYQKSGKPLMISKTVLVA